MKNQIHSCRSVDNVAIPVSRHFKSLLTAIFFFFLCLHMQGQQLATNKSPLSLREMNPELEKKVRNTLKQNSRKLQLVENVGQPGLSNNVVAYFSSANETVFIERDRLRIVVAASATASTKHKAPNEPNAARETKQYQYSSFSILFKGSKGFSSLEKKDPFQIKRNFIAASDAGQPTISSGSFAEIILRNIYEGIDLRLYSQANCQLEFDWIIWPGADAAKIKMEFSGQQDMTINDLGALELKLGLGKFTMSLPESYYVTPAGKLPAKISFSLSGQKEVHFSGFGKNRNAYPLIIDPDLLWGTFFDGANLNFDEYLYAIEYNYNNELIYCAGAASLQVSTLYAAALSSAYDGTFDGLPDALIYTLTKNGELITSITYLGGTAADVAIGLSLSTSFVYIAGYTNSADFPVTKTTDGLFPAFDSVYHGGNEGFVAVMSLDLQKLHYASFLGGDGNQKALTVRAIADSTFYISLSTTDTLPVTDPNYIQQFADDIFAGNSESWIGKFTSFSALSFGTYVGGNNDDIINDFQVLSSGDIVFAGSTKNITEINASIPNNPSGQEALFGKIIVPSSGPVVFGILDKIGGSNNDYGWGIYNLGDTVSILVGQTNSSDFPLGSGTVFQNTRGGNIDGFIARIYNDGISGYKATFTGGSDNDILVSVRPVTVNHQVALLSWGSTESTDLATKNFNSGTFYSGNNAGGLDMMFVICDWDLVSKYYLSYIGGSANDYLGITGAPVGSNHLFYNAADSVLYLGTTTHSSHTTQTPMFVGRGIADITNTGVPVFDETKGNGSNDTHVIIAISTSSLFALLPLKLLSFRSQVLADCSIQLSWSALYEATTVLYTLERSSDGINFERITSMPPVNGVYTYNDNTAPGTDPILYYRVKATDVQGRNSYAAVQPVHSCHHQNKLITVYPAIIQQSFTISGLNNSDAGHISIDLLDAAGKKIFSKKMVNNNQSQTIFLKNELAAGIYFIYITDINTGKLLLTKKIIAGH